MDALPFISAFTSICSLILAVIIAKLNHSAKIKDQLQDHETDIAVLKSQLETANHQLARINDKIDHILEEL